MKENKKDSNKKNKNENEKDNINMDTENVWSVTDPDIPSDVCGSYTGIPVSQFYDREEQPVQDADDL